MRRWAASIMSSVSQSVGERILSLAATESEYRSFWTQVLGALDFFLEVGLAADVRSITLEGFDSVFALLRLYSNTSCLAAKLGHLLGRLEACVSVG